MKVKVVRYVFSEYNDYYRFVLTNIISFKSQKFQESQSEDEPHILKHLVFKPVLQQIHEVITPRRLITQEIKPVFEDIQTLVARNSHGGNGGGFSQSNSLLGSMFGGGRRSGGGGGGGYSRGNSLYGSMSVSGGGYGRSSGRY